MSSYGYGYGYGQVAYGHPVAVVHTFQPVAVCKFCYHTNGDHKSTCRRYTGSSSYSSSSSSEINSNTSSTNQSCSVCGASNHLKHYCNKCGDENASHLASRCPRS